MAKVLAPFFVTSMLYLEYTMRIGIGQDVRLCDYPVRVLLKVFHEYSSELEHQATPSLCTLCDKEVRRLGDAGAVLGLFDPALAGDQEMMWMALCWACFKEAPDTAERRMMDRFAKAMDGKVFDATAHPTPQ